MVGTNDGRRRISRRLVAGFLFIIAAYTYAADTASLEFDPERVVRGERFTIQIRTSIPWGEEVEIFRPELIGPMVWWAYPYARPWTVETDDGKSVRMIEVLASIRIDQPGFHTIEPFRVRAGDREAVTALKEIIGLEADEAVFPYPITTNWRKPPDVFWQGQAVPVVLEARNLVSLALADSAVLNTAPVGLLEDAYGLGGIVTRPHANDILYDVPMASWIWTVAQPGKYTFPGVRISVAGLNRSTPSFPVEVLPLPDSVQSTAAVGHFTLDVDWEDLQYRVGDILSVRLRVEGTGNLNVLKLPEPDMESASLVSQGSSSSYVPSSNGFDGWREERFDFQIEDVGELQLNVPGWTWMEPEGDGRVRKKNPVEGTVRALEAAGEKGSGDAEFLLGAELFRFRKAKFHWRNQYWFLMALPGFVALLTMFIIRRPGVGVLAAAAVLPLLLSASNLNLEEVEIAVRAAELGRVGDWDRAKGLYEKLQDETGEIPGLLHDLSISEMEAGNPDLAVSLIRRALFLRPGSRRLSDTLKLLENRFGLTDQVSVPLKISPSLIFVVWLLAINAFFFSLTLLMFRRNAREVILFVSTILFLTSSSIVLGYTDKLWKRPTAVVRLDSEPLRKIPGPLATDWIQLPAGSAVEITAFEDDDCLVRTGYGLDGWLPRTSLIFITEVVDGF